MKFICEIYQYQIDRGRYFLHEHPWHAKSWELACVQAIKTAPGVGVVRCDQCMTGLETKPEREGGATKAMKPTAFMSNSECILEALSVRCDKQHEHQPLTGGRAKQAATYPDVLCDRICEGMRMQAEADNEKMERECENCLMNVMDNSCMEESTDDGVFWDDVNDLRLDSRKVREARTKEVGYIRKMRVYD